MLYPGTIDRPLTADEFEQVMNKFGYIKDPAIKV